MNIECFLKSSFHGNMVLMKSQDFYSNVLELLISSRNAMKISIGHPVEFLLDVP